MSEFYLDERPTEEESSQWGGGAIGSGGSSGSSGDGIGSAAWGGGSGSGSGSSSGGDSDDDLESGEWPDAEDPWYLVSSWRQSQTEVLLNGDGYIQGCGPWVLKGDNGCMELVIKAQISGDSSGTHVRCILLSFTMFERTGSTTDPFDWLFGNVPVINGTMTIRAKWQAGHWDYSTLNTVRFKLFSTGDDAVITPWLKLPLGAPYVDIASIDVVHGQLVLNSLRLA